MRLTAELGEAAVRRAEKPAAEAGVSGLVRFHRGEVLLSPAHVRRVLADHPEHLTTIVQTLCERLEEAESRIASMGHDDAGRRLARLLCELERHGHPAHRGTSVIGTRIPVSLSHAELAAWIGTCRETVARALRRWRDRDIISAYYRTIVVHDLESLARIAGIQVRRQAWNWPAAAGGATRRPVRRPAVPVPGTSGARRGAA